MKKPWEWERKDLDNLIGQMESMRLEFKSSQIFIKKDDTSVGTDLSKEISAFANSEGGVIVIGIKESTKSPKKALSIDEGVDVKEWNPEKIQAVIESNISPHLTGVRVKPIYLDSDYSRCVYVISVPPGSTAYQAKDKRYYGRSEYEVKALPDHEIRLRMFRGKAPFARILIDNPRRDVVHRQEFSEKKHSYDIVDDDGYTFNIMLENLGEINITQFKAELSFSGSSEILSLPERYSSSFKDGWTGIKSSGLESERTQSSTRLNIYPGDKFHLERRSFIALTENLSSYRLMMHWKLYLKDTFPISGEINIIDFFENV